MFVRFKKNRVSLSPKKKKKTNFFPNNSIFFHCNNIVNQTCEEMIDSRV